jgi:hypothetical protein
MIHYQLRCRQQHEFDGWFKDSASFDAQAQRGLLECPVCADVHIERALMAPAVPRKKDVRAAEPPAEAPAAQQAPDALPGAPMTVTEGTMPDRMRAALQRLRAEVEKNCDYVGDAFADEARRIHRGESQRRGIYGETTPEQAETLQDEGIAVARIPWVPRADG